MSGTEEIVVAPRPAERDRRPEPARDPAQPVAKPQASAGPNAGAWKRFLVALLRAMASWPS
jgi:hypothetical protein